jgi:hypothetical protein
MEEAIYMRNAWCRWAILTAVFALLFSLLAAPVAFGAVLTDKSAIAAQPEEEGEEPEEVEGEEPEEEKDPADVLEEVLERIEAIFQKGLDALARAMEEAAEQAKEALELAWSNVERVRDWLMERGLPPYEGGPFADRPQPGDGDGDEGGEEDEGGKPDLVPPVQPPIPDDLPVTPPVPWGGR